jgi:23S rRNA-/tRNA-specific pseudouridylate synthase
MASVAEGVRDERCLRSVLRNQTGCELLAVHRLDKEVSGVIIFAKHPCAHVFLNEQFSSRLAANDTPRSCTGS